VHETDPVGVAGEQARFLNAAVVGYSTLDARELLTALQAIEGAAGRERPYPGAARTLDLDLILFGDRVIDQPDLSVPHPRVRDRRFVLEPAGRDSAGLEGPGDWLHCRELLTRLGTPDR
jgi:2-amino-4-hydroxy-6-hydroxymethyldihydropteridine diphosphokinase